MPLKPQELGDRLHVDLRAGVTGISKWRGVSREGDPACPADDQLSYAENARLAGGKIISRGGQTLVNSSAASGCIDGFFDAGDMGAQDPGAYVETTLYFPLLSTGHLGAMSTAGTVTTPVAEVVDRSGIALFDDYIYWEGATGGGQTQFRRVAAGGTAAEDTFTIAQIHASDLGPYVGGVAESKFWIVYGYDKTLTPNNGRIYSWDGVSAVSEHSFTYAQTSSQIEFDGTWDWAFTPFLGGFVAMMTTGENRRFFYRDSGGSLTFPALAGTLTSPNCTGRISVYNSKAYIPIKDASGHHIQSFDGATVAVAQTLPASSVIEATEVFGGCLYYAWLTSSGGSPDVKIGRYDGATWTDSWDTVATSVGWSVEDLISHNGSLYILARGTSAIWKSDGADTTTFTEVNSTDDVVGFGVSVQA